MPRNSIGYGSRYRCPACDKIVKTGEARKRLATFVAHEDCDVPCGICGELLQQPPIGSAHTITVYLNQPVHRTCREEA